MEKEVGLCEQLKYVNLGVSGNSEIKIARNPLLLGWKLKLLYRMTWCVCVS